MNKKRKAIWDKSGGKCWYCGCNLPEKGWHADHVEPVYRKSKFVPAQERKTRFKTELRQTGDVSMPERDNDDNLVPSCAPCNLFKATMSIEQFRSEISMQASRARDYSVNFRTAERFGMIRLVEKQVVFWFEENGIE